MSFKTWSSAICLLPFALATLPALPAERHNLILLVPAVLPAAAVNHDSAPALARLKSEGVYFSNSHSGFPQLVVTGPDAAGTSADVVRLLAAATESYSTALVDSTRDVEGPSFLAARFLDSDTSLDTIVDVTLPRFKEAKRPFVLVYRFGTRSDGQEDIERPVSRQTGGSDEPALVSAVITADEALAAIEEELRRLGLYDTTNIIVAAEQGTSFVWKGSDASGWIDLSAEQARWGTLPPGFLAMDLASALADEDPSLSLFDPDDDYTWMNHSPVPHPKRGNGVIAVTADEPMAFVEARGDHDLIYISKNLFNSDAARLAKAIVEALFKFSYTSGVFVKEPRFGRLPGTLPLEHIGWGTSAATRVPDIVVTFASVPLQCDEPTLCTAAIADTLRKEGHTLRGSFSRADTWNFMAARGPDFRSRLDNTTPASNADVVKTMRVLLQLSSDAASGSPGRVLEESLRGYEGKAPRVRKREIVSRATRDGLRTEIHLQSVGSTMYFDAAGGSGWTVGIAMRPAPLEWRPWMWDWSFLYRVRVSLSPEDPKFEALPPLFPPMPKP